MTRWIVEHDWSLVRSSGHRLWRRPNGHVNEWGNPKQGWPNAATARWYRDNSARSSIKGTEAYECDVCGRWHLGRPRTRVGARPGPAKRRRIASRRYPWVQGVTPSATMTPVWRSMQSMADFEGLP